MKLEYQKKIICFVDILGFKNLVQRKYRDSPEIIKEILTMMHEMSSQKPYNNDFIAFSDTVINIFELEPSLSEFGQSRANYLNVILDDLARVQSNILLKYDIHLRGSVVIGDIIYDQEPEVIFGNGLIKAHELESNNALYPRIILDASVMEYLEAESLNHIITRDVDGIYFIDYIKWFTSNLRFLDEKHIIRMKEVLIKQLEEPGLNTAVMQKIHWVVSFFNKSLEKLSEKFPVVIGHKIKL